MTSPPVLMYADHDVTAFLWKRSCLQEQKHKPSVLASILISPLVRRGILTTTPVGGFTVPILQMGKLRCKEIAGFKLGSV